MMLYIDVRAISLMLLPCVVITLSVSFSIAFLLCQLRSSGRIKVRLEQSLELIVFVLTPERERERAIVIVIASKDSEGQACRQSSGDCDRSDAFVLVQTDVAIILPCAMRLQKVCGLVRRLFA